MSAVRDWVVTYKARPRAQVLVWAVFAGVPAELKRDDVTTALESWQRWPQWQARIAPGGVLGLRPRTARDEDKITGQAIPWETLAPVSKRIQVEVSGELYAAVARCARASDQSIAKWVTVALQLYADVDASTVIRGPVEPAFIDVPLPGVADHA